MHRFYLGDSDCSKEERVEKFYDQIESFCHRPSLHSIINILEKVSEYKLSDFEDITEFLQRFNSRSGERQIGNSKTEEINRMLEPYRSELYDAFWDLGFITVNEPVFDKRNYDYILILGGGNDANLNRTKKALREVKRMPNAKKIAALSTFRPLGKNEIEKTHRYTNEIMEFGVVTDCMSQVFEVGQDADVIKEEITDDPTTSSKIIRFKKKYDDRVVLESYAAPKGDDERARADTRDTFDFFFDNNDLPEHSTVLLVTSNIYPVQQIPFIEYAIEKKLNSDLVGNWERNKITRLDTFDPSAYINELIKMFNEFQKLAVCLNGR